MIPSTSGILDKQAEIDDLINRTDDVKNKRKLKSIFNFILDLVDSFIGNSNRRKENKKKIRTTTARTAVPSINVDQEYAGEYD